MRRRCCAELVMEKVTESQRNKRGMCMLFVVEAFTLPVSLVEKPRAPIPTIWIFTLSIGHESFELRSGSSASRGAILSSTIPILKERAAWEGVSLRLLAQG